MSGRRPGGSEPPPVDTASVLAAVLEASPVAVVALDGQGRIRLWSAAARRIFGWTEAEVAARPLSLILGGHAAMVRERAVAADDAGPITFAGTRKDGEPVHLSAWTAPTRDVGGAVTGLVAVFQDVNISRDIEQRFLEAQRLEVVDRIAGAIAHDLKNVLSAIKGFAVMAGEGLPEDDQARGDMDQILKAAERGALLAQKLLAFSRNPVVQPNVLDINLLLQSIDNTIRRLIGPRLELVLRHAPDLGLVKADAAQVEQVVVNLVLNARDAMPAGGRLVIETANIELEGDRARASGLAAGRYVRVTVADTGPGIPPETQARMFEPFFTTKGPDRALGLGLPATLNIVRQMGGQIAARSEHDRGTTFTVDIPLTGESPPPELGSAGRRRERPAAGGGAETILVVEDDDLVRMLTVKVLRRRGYQVLEASVPSEAKQRLEGHSGPIHLLLSDVGLPHVSGPELARELAAQRPDMKVLFMSGYGRTALAERGLTPGLGVLEKPFSPDALLERIRAILGDKPTR